MLNHLWILFLAVFLLVSCQKLPKKLVPKPDQPDILTCDKLEPKNVFNGLRIKAVQDTIQSFVLQRKALPVTPQLTEQLAVLERIRRRITWPLISSKLAPATVTKQLSEEINRFKDILRSESPTSPANQELINQLDQELLAKLDKPEYWLCPVIPPVVPDPVVIPPQVQERNIEGKTQTIIYEN